MGADIVERLEAIASREDQVFGAMSNGLEIREAAAEIVRLRGEVNPWQHAVDQQRVIAHLGVAADGVSLEEATKQLGELIDWHIDVATDPQVNGGYALVKQAPAPAMPNGVEARRHAANEWADMATNGVQWLRNIRAGISTADEALAEMESNLLRVRALNDEAQHMQLRAADNRDAAGVEGNGPDLYSGPHAPCIHPKRPPAAVPAGEAVGGHYCDNCDGVAPETCFYNTTPPAPVQAAPQEGGDSHAFKNFHRSLCARFGYTHDENDWRRDLASLEEHIARMAAHHSACELGVVRELVDDFTAKGHHSCARDLKAALQHRGDSRGGEGYGG